MWKTSRKYVEENCSIHEGDYCEPSAVHMCHPLLTFESRVLGATHRLIRGRIMCEGGGT